MPWIFMAKIVFLDGLRRIFIELFDVHGQKTGRAPVLCPFPDVADVYLVLSVSVFGVSFGILNVTGSVK